MKGRGEIRTLRLLFSCFVLPCQIHPVSWGNVWLLARLRSSCHLVPPVSGWLCRQEPGLERPLDTPSLPTHLAHCCPSGIYGSHPWQWASAWKPGVEVGDRGGLWQAGGCWRMEERGRALSKSEWFVTRLQSWVKEEEPSEVKRESWENSYKDIQRQWNFLRLLLPSRNILMHLPSHPLWKGHPLHSAEEYILCSNHFDWVVVFIMEAGQSGEFTTRTLTSNFLEKSLKFMTSYFFFYSFFRKKKKGKEFSKGIGSSGSGSLESRRAQGHGLQICLHIGISWRVIFWQSERPGCTQTCEVSPAGMGPKGGHSCKAPRWPQAHSEGLGGVPRGWSSWCPR